MSTRTSAVVGFVVTCWEEEVACSKQLPCLRSSMYPIRANRDALLPRFPKCSWKARGTSVILKSQRPYEPWSEVHENVLIRIATSYRATCWAVKK